MDIIASLPLVKLADKKNAAVGAFNVNFFSQAVGILRGVKAAKGIAIIQASKGAIKFQGGADIIAKMVYEASKKVPGVIYSMHLDHGDIETCKKCVDSGFGSVMIDASTTKDGKPTDLGYNISQSKEVVDYAHKKGVSVEVEHGVLAGEEEHVSAEESTYANPEDVKKLISATMADMVAISYGTKHGPNKGLKAPKLSIETVKKCKDALEGMNCYLVSHGSSTVPQDIVSEINQYGGDVKKAQGIKIDDIQEAIANGIRKVNIDTDLRMAITAVIRKYFHDNPGIEDTDETLRIIYDTLITGKIDIGKNHKELIDPRDYLGGISKNLIRVDPIGGPLADMMRLVEDRVAKHVEYLVKAFGSDYLEDEAKKLRITIQDQKL